MIKRNTILFICKANVWRSQLAEYLYNEKFSWAMSCAGKEWKKEKYKGIADSPFSSYIKKNYAIDISKQQIHYIRDISHAKIRLTETIVFLYNPKEEPGCDKECMIDGINPYEYLQNLRKKIIISPVQDPFETNEEGYENIYRSIRNLVESINDK